MAHHNHVAWHHMQAARLISHTSRMQASTLSTTMGRCCDDTATRSVDSMYTWR